MSITVRHQIMQEQKTYTYEEYAKWDDGNRWELIDGVPYMMSAPTIAHQDILLNLGTQFRNFLRGKKCKVIIAPVDVRLNHKTKDNTVVQPDVIVVCDRDKIKNGKSLLGAPDLAIEILSPSSIKHDKILKFRKYKLAGVREYWIVDPDSKTVDVHILEEGHLGIQYYDNTEKIPVHVLDGFEIDLNEIFEPDEEVPPPLSPAQLAELATTDRG